jgi:sterol desaturase/sphingolipid hydroxylase (fatty acid hydroxylase superfamily)
MLVLVISIFGFGTFHFIKDNQPTSAEVIYYLAFAIGSMALITNYCSNIYLLEKFYPNEEMSKNHLLIISFILLSACLIIGFLTITYIITFFDAVVYAVKTDKLFTRTVIVAFLFGMILLLCYYIFWMQVALRRTIQRNYATLFSMFPETK